MIFAVVGATKLLSELTTNLIVRRNSGGNLIILTLNADLCRPLSIIRESASIGSR